MGVVVIEVKDWDFSAMNYRWEDVHGSRVRNLVATKGGKSFGIENPLEKVKLYSNEILELYCPSIGIQFRNTPVVSSVVFFSKLTTQESKEFVKAGIQDIKDEVVEKYYPAIGYDVLTLGILDSIPFLNMKSSKYMKPEYASDLRYWLEEPRAKIDQRTPITLSPKQKELISREKTKNGYRRIRGSAGSGKSLMLAHKAASLALQGEKVLVVTFNATLCNYLSDLVARSALPKTGVRNRVEFLNYHSWAKRICVFTGNTKSYDLLPWDKQFDRVLNETLPNLVDSILQESNSEERMEELMYDAILVDEGQDFRLLWWQTLARAIREDGEAILVADKTQDLYGTANAWTDEAMDSAGFRGPWNELKISYRLPTDYLPYIRDFLERFIPDEHKIEPESAQSELSIANTHMTWVQTHNEIESIEACVNSVLEFPIRKRADESLVYPDIVILAETIKSGFQMVKKLGNKGLKVRHTFGLKGEGNEQKAIRKQKKAFFFGAEQIKATTIHSYKGWESTCLVIEILSGTSISNIASVYTALTRLKASERGGDSHIVVVCSAPEFEEYGKTWANFQRV